MAIAYTDPTYAAHCPPPFTPPAGRCDGQIAKLVANDERAFIHDASGARIHKFNDPYFQYQEVFNVTRPRAPRLRAHDRARSCGTRRCSTVSKPTTPAARSPAPTACSARTCTATSTRFGVEIRSDEEFIAGASAMLAAAGRPLMINGGDPRGTGPAYGGRFLDLPFVMSDSSSKAASTTAAHYLYSDRDDKFRREENALLAVMAHRKSAVCFPTGDTTPPHRLYAYAAGC